MRKTELSTNLTGESCEEMCVDHFSPWSSDFVRFNTFLDIRQDNRTRWQNQNFSFFLNFVSFFTSIHYLCGSFPSRSGGLEPFRLLVGARQGTHETAHTPITGLTCRDWQLFAQTYRSFGATNQTKAHGLRLWGEASAPRRSVQTLQRLHFCPARKSNPLAN